MKFNILAADATGKRQSKDVRLHPFLSDNWPADVPGFDAAQTLVFPNYQDYGYGIFLLDDKSRDYVLKNIQNEKDPFLRSMMWGALWDSVREGELDPGITWSCGKVLLQKPAEVRAKYESQKDDVDDRVAAQPRRHGDELLHLRRRTCRLGEPVWGRPRSVDLADTSSKIFDRADAKCETAWRSGSRIIGHS
jgi:hypothetical protein